MDKGIRGNLIALTFLLLLGVSALSPSLARLVAGAGGGEHLYVPVISDGNMPGSPPTTAATSGPVFGLLGRLAAVQGMRFSHSLTAADGAVYGLVGATPDIEQQLSALLAETAAPMLKVWGDVQPGTAPPLIVVSGVLHVETPAAGGVAGASIPVGIVQFDLVNLHSEASESSPRVGAVIKNQACNITGRTPAHSWWLLDCADGQVGWIDARLVQVQGSSSDVPIVTSAVAVEPTPLPEPTPTPYTFQGWRMDMFSNPYLSGDPTAVADVPDINFNWGNGSPSPQIPVDGFSVRLQRRMTFGAGFYTFVAEADDGVRVWVDDDLLIDAWHGATGRPFSAGRVLNGEHTVRVEHFEVSGSAYLRLTIQVGSPTPQWDASYFSGVNPTGNPAVTRQEPKGQNPLDFNWGASSPAPDKIGVDFWSARWVGSFAFEGGNYVFHVRSDDGVRVWLNDTLVIDAWRDGLKEVQNRFIGVGRDTHTVTVEYYERTGLAQITLWWTLDSSYVGPR